MDVAQVWSEHQKQSSQNESNPRSASPNSPLESHSVQHMGTQIGPDHQGGLEGDRGHERERQEPEEPPGPVKVAIIGWDTQTSIPAPSTVESPQEPEREQGASLKLPDLLTPTEKRKSSWEKYSELIMPALEEEWTPVPSPMPTLNKPPVPGYTKEEPVAVTIPETKKSEESKVGYLPLDLLSATLELERKIIRVSPADLVAFGKMVGLLCLSILISRSRFPELCCSENRCWTSSEIDTQAHNC